MQLLLTDTATLESNNDLPLDVFDRFGKVAKFDNITRDELLTAAADKDIILCNKTVIDREIMNAAPRLRYIGLFATGYNNIDIAAAKEKGITVCNAGSYSTNAVTQQVIGYILMHYTKIPQYDAFVKQGGWKCSGRFFSAYFFGRRGIRQDFGNSGLRKYRQSGGKSRRRAWYECFGAHKNRA